MEIVSGQVAERGRLDTAVAALVDGMSRSRASQLIREGRVAVQGNSVTRPAKTVRPGEVIEITIPPPVPEVAVPQDLPVTLVYQDSDIAVVNKAAGMVVHPGAGHHDGTLVNALLHHIQDLSGIGGVMRPGIVHRLDKGTSGLLVVAKHDDAHHHLSDQFAKHTAGRDYLALCNGKPTERTGTIRSRLARHPSDRKRWASTHSNRGKLAVTHWEVLARCGTICLIQCHLETGRTHQIRVHLKEAGWPIVGDPMYRMRQRVLPESLASIEACTGERPMLHAWCLRLVHPRTDKAMTFVASLPEDYLACVDALGCAEALPEPLRVPRDASD